MLRLLLALLLLAILSLADGSRSAEQLRPADELLAAGAEAYSRGDWPGVILQMERALRARVAHRERLAGCRSGCAANHSAEDPAQEPRRPLGDLRFFQQLLRRAACLRRCLPDSPSRYQLGEEVNLEFRKRSPYNYLQVAYFKVRGGGGWGPGRVSPRLAPPLPRGKLLGVFFLCPPRGSFLCCGALSDANPKRGSAQSETGGGNCFGVGEAPPARLSSWEGPGATSVEGAARSPLAPPHPLRRVSAPPALRSRPLGLDWLELGGL